MAAPSRTQVLDSSVVSAIDTYLTTVPVDVIFEDNLLLSSVFNAGPSAGNQGAVKSLYKARPGNISRQNGREVVIPVRYGRSTNTKAFNRADVVPLGIDDPITMQRDGFANYIDTFVLTWDELQEVSGPQGVINLAQAKADACKQTLAETIEGDLWSTNNGTTTNPKEVLGIQFLIAEAPGTGVIWGINRATYSWHQNQFTDATSAFSAGGLDDMRAMRVSTAGVSGVDKASAIFTTPAVWQAYTKEAEDIHQITSGRTAELGFEVAVYQGIPVVYSDQCVAGSMFFLNMKYMQLVLPGGGAFQVRTPANPADQVIDLIRQLIFRMQWGFQRYDRQGVIFNYTDT